jgi:hypothetical protein
LIWRADGAACAGRDAATTPNNPVAARTERLVRCMDAFPHQKRKVPPHQAAAV